MNLTKWNDYKLPILEARKGKPDPVIDEAFNQISAIFQEIRDWAKTQTHAAPVMSPIERRKQAEIDHQQQMQAAIGNISSQQGMNKITVAKKAGVPLLMRLGLARTEEDASRAWDDIRAQRNSKKLNLQHDAIWTDPGTDKLPNVFLGLENVQEIDFLSDKEAEVRKIITNVHKTSQSAANANIHNTVTKAMMASQNALSPEQFDAAIYNLKRLADFMSLRKDRIQLYFDPMVSPKRKIHIGVPEKGKIVLMPDGENAADVAALISTNKMLEIHPGKKLARKGKKVAKINIGVEGSVDDFITGNQ